MTVLGAIFILVGATFAALAGVGVLRFPDLYTRLHAASKAGAVGVGFVLLGAGFASGDLATVARCVFGLVFLILTSPVSAHLLARSSLKSGVSPTKITSINEWTDNS